MPSRRGWMMRGAGIGFLGLGLIALWGCGGRIAHPFGRGASARAAPAAAIGVNGYLWRATLDTLAFMPLASADPYGGVVITDWYVNPGKARRALQGHRLHPRLAPARRRPERHGVQGSQQRGRRLGDLAHAAQTSTDIENAILTRARQLRLSNLRG